MVGNSPLAAICAESGLYRHLHQKSHQIQQSINTYLTALQKAKQKEYAAADDDLRERGQYWFDVNPPKVNDILLLLRPADLTICRLFSTSWSPS